MWRIFCESRPTLDSLHFGIAVARVAEVGSIEEQIDILGEAADGAERLG